MAESEIKRNSLQSDRKEETQNVGKDLFDQLAYSALVWVTQKGHFGEEEVLLSSTLRCTKRIEININ